MMSISESLSLSAVGSHMQGFQSDCATITHIQMGIHCHPCILSEQHSRSCNFSLVCSNFLPRASLCSPVRNTCPFSVSVPLVNMQHVPLPLPDSQSHSTALVALANQQQQQHGKGLSFIHKAQCSPTCFKTCRRPVGSFGSTHPLCSPMVIPMN